MREKGCRKTGTVLERLRLRDSDHLLHHDLNRLINSNSMAQFDSGRMSSVTGTTFESPIIVCQYTGANITNDILIFCTSCFPSLQQSLRIVFREAGRVAPFSSQAMGKN
eukprot:g78973.t1